MKLLNTFCVGYTLASLTEEYIDIGCGRDEVQLWPLGSVLEQLWDIQLKSLFTVQSAASVLMERNIIKSTTFSLKTHFSPT